ncbi:DNA-binding transcriptional regulator, MerR family [Streptomyces zhaozhouensis]|uniref:DNA-binding transcriptional regulator, MerR family n=1 Tax=Streptomyces zhaozhouensis TaxID=1300267 RepID=A0A286DUK3_9ACTN|nr:MerR family transcriptional regulator [Streptomyces zhaozhouensis]SOD62244.1 DNA-binding transcriptional regulator, MerR family [Streptomyces zhaozhouensis]
MRIGELAARTGVSVRSLRYYEEQGLLSSARSASGQRHYTEGAVGRVELIQQLYNAGLSSRTVAQLLPCVDAPSHRATDVALEKLARERDRISAHIDELAATRDALDAVMETARAYRTGQWPPQGAGDCAARRRAG